MTRASRRPNITLDSDEEIDSDEDDDPFGMGSMNADDDADDDDSDDDGDADEDDDDTDDGEPFVASRRRLGVSAPAVPETRTSPRDARGDGRNRFERGRPRRRRRRFGASPCSRFDEPHGRSQRVFDRLRRRRAGVFATAPGGRGRRDGGGSEGPGGRPARVVAVRGGHRDVRRRDRRRARPGGGARRRRALARKLDEARGLRRKGLATGQIDSRTIEQGSERGNTHAKKARK